MPQGGNYNDDIEFPESVLLPADEDGAGAREGQVAFARALDNPNIMRLTAPLLEQALGIEDPSAAEAMLSQDARLNAVLLSLPLAPSMPPDGVDGDQEVATAQRLLEYLCAQRRAMSATSLQQDQVVHSRWSRRPSCAHLCGSQRAKARGRTSSQTRGAMRGQELQHTLALQAEPNAPAGADAATVATPQLLSAIKYPPPPRSPLQIGIFRSQSTRLSVGAAGDSGKRGRV